MTAFKTIRRGALGARAIARHVKTARRLRNPDEPLRLHLGCGRRRLRGFVNIDHNMSPATDYVGDIAKLPCPPKSAERIETYHVIEHIPRPVVDGVLSHWHEVLQHGGVLVLECPDFEADVKQLLEGNEERMFSIFGRQRFQGDAHHWGYSAESLGEVLEAAGFVNVRTAPPADYHAESEPCIRVEAQKP